MHLRIQSFASLVLVTSTLAFLSGCRTPPAPPPPPDVSAHPLVRETPIIDVHTHTFNARYLPIEGVLLGKRDAAPPWSWFLTDACAKDVAEAFIAMTELSAISRDEKLTGVRRRPEALAEIRARGGLVCRTLIGLMERAIAAEAYREGDTPAAQLARLDAVSDSMNKLERRAVRTAVTMMGFDHHFETADEESGLRGAVRFLWMLTQNDARMPELFRHDYRIPEANPAASPLMVSHMMDLGPVYDQHADGSSLLDFQSQQIRRMQAFAESDPHGNLLYFVAYNPYRRGPVSGWDDGSALRLVQTAVREHGAWGVKVYPPSGYRPVGNRLEPRPRTISRYPGRQWDARYAPDDPDAAEALDRRLEQFLLWCIREDIPVFAHCSTEEFEARKGYGIWHANPQFWRRFLEAHPEPDGSPCRLRLTLAHAGGGDFWYADGPHADWGKTVYELCTRYPNVYCEITTNSQFLHPDIRAKLADRLARAFDESAPGNSNGRPFAFSKKLLYGTDWYLPDPADRHAVLNATRNVFLDDRLRPHFEDYFYRNALRFLNVDRALAGQTPNSVPPALRARLESLHRRPPLPTGP